MRRCRAVRSSPGRVGGGAAATAETGRNRGGPDRAANRRGGVGAVSRRRSPRAPPARSPAGVLPPGAPLSSARRALVRSSVDTSVSPPGRLGGKLPGFRSSDRIPALSQLQTSVRPGASCRSTVSYPSGRPSYGRSIELTFDRGGGRDGHVGSTDTGPVVGWAWVRGTADPAGTGGADRARAPAGRDRGPVHRAGQPGGGSGRVAADGRGAPR